MIKTLLPSGCYDVLPPRARQESELAGSLLGVFQSYGYEQVAPPLLEYSDNLLAGRGVELSAQIFRVMDPGAHRVMGIRPDITLQISRIAQSRLHDVPRPLRLCYNGLILRMTGEQLKSDRQLRQTGIELIGAFGAEADAEIIIVAAEAVQKAGVKNLSIDLNLPGIVSSLLATEKLEEHVLHTLFEALANKDISAIKRMPLTYRDSLVGLIESASGADTALASLKRLDLPEEARKQCENLREVVSVLQTRNPGNWSITIDAAEGRGFGYHAGIGFSMFVPGVPHEIGRGGRYRVGSEEATGFTLYVETLRDLLPLPARLNKILIASGVHDNTAASLRAEGYVTLNARPGIDLKKQAKELGCEAIFNNGTLEKL